LSPAVYRNGESSLVHKDELFINHYFELSKSQPFRNLTHKEYLSLSDEKELWFLQREKDTLVCSICLGRTCNVHFPPSQPFIPCPEGESNIIEVKDENRYTYAFDRESFYETFRSSLSKPYESKNTFSPFMMLGEYQDENYDWLVGFLPSHSIKTNVYACLEALKTSGKHVLLLFTDNKDWIDTSFQGVLSTHNIFIASWNHELTDVISKIYEDQKASLHVKESILQLNELEEDTTIEISALERAATTADGDGFEDEVYKVIRRVFQTVVPFGGQYKGFAVPDGLITQPNDTPFPVLFYDCKSFKGEEYKHKSQIPMQVNYYESFLEDFFTDQQVENAGFVIFSSSFPEEVQKQITGSAQWKYVEQNCNIYFISVPVLNRIEKLLNLFEAGGNFLSEDFFNLCFKQQTLLIKHPKSRKLYESLFGQNGFEHFYFLKEEQVEVALINSFLNYVLTLNKMEGLSRSLKVVVENALHENLSRKVEKPNLFYFNEVFLHQLDSLVKELHPLSIYMILKRNEDDFYKILGEKKFNQIEENMLQRLDSLTGSVKS
jgi:hypothetical protein